MSIKAFKVNPFKVCVILIQETVDIYNHWMHTSSILGHCYRCKLFVFKLMLILAWTPESSRIIVKASVQF